MITFTGGSQTNFVNQQVGGGFWNLLGTFNFATGTAGDVRITDAIPDAGKKVVADAIKFIYLGP